MLQRVTRGTPLTERIRAWVVVSQVGCWIWQGRVDKDGYGRITVGKPLLAHRVSYEAFKEPIPRDLCLDHLCHNTRCCNPAHLEPVTIAENNRRARRGPRRPGAVLSHCRRGHEFTPENIYWTTPTKRACKKCISARKRLRSTTQREAA